MGKAVKIIDVDEDGSKFILLEDVLMGIFSKVPEEMPVAIVGVVGAFRTGKSFLLEFFLRYLRGTDPNILDNQLHVEDQKLAWMTQDGKLKGGDADGDGFKWSAGDKRCTTGIWLWNEHFIRKDPVTEEQMAVFLMDTQGMYDHVTGQHLTATIFGLGSLLSNYTVFNVVMQIQEDHIQQLALFSEYGRIALNEANAETNGGKKMHAFQKLEFLVRDFTHFKKGSKKRSPDALQKDMRKYLDDVMTQRFQKDLKEVRDQIELCYEKILCYCLPYPGEEVAEEDEDFGGELDKIKPRFRVLLGDYIRRVFNDRISIKKIQGEPVTAMKLFEYVKVYCQLFQESKVFPKAITLFKATQQASIAFATNKSIRVYNNHMTSVGTGTHFLEDIDFKKTHEDGLQLAEICFNENVRSGDDQLKRTSFETLQVKLQERFSEFDNANRLKGKEEEALIASAIEVSKLAYTDKMSELKVGEEYNDEKVVDDSHVEAFEIALAAYEANASDRNHKFYENGKRNLQKDLETLFSRYKEANELVASKVEGKVQTDIDEAVEVYNKKMDSFNIKEYYREYEAMNEFHKQASVCAFSSYEANMNPSNENFYKSKKAALKRSLEWSFSSYKQINAENEKEAEALVASESKSAVALYHERMKGLIANGNYQTDEQLLLTHNGVMVAAMEVFNRNRNKTNETFYQKETTNLENVLELNFSKYKVINQSKERAIKELLEADIEDALVVYNKLMHSFLQNASSQTEEDLENCHKKAAAEGLEAFDAKSNSSTKKFYDKGRKQLKKEFDTQLHNHKQKRRLQEANEQSKFTESVRQALDVYVDDMSMAVGTESSCSDAQLANHHTRALDAAMKALEKLTSNSSGTLKESAELELQRAARKSFAGFQERNMLLIRAEQPAPPTGPSAGEIFLGVLNTAADTFLAATHPIYGLRRR